MVGFSRKQKMPTACMGATCERGSKPRICFVALKAYDLLSHRRDISHMGGAEVQQVRIASWLLRRGYAVSFVTLDHGQPDGINVGGITVWKAYAERDGLPGLRFVLPRWSGLWAALTRAQADVYYQRGAGNETGQVAIWCRLHRRKFIFAVASDPDCVPLLHELKSWREKALCRIGLRLADEITAQTTTQQRLLQQNVGAKAVLVRNCGWDTAERSSGEAAATADHRVIRVLWVGRISREKRLEWLLDVAERCPDIAFDVVGAASTESDYTLSLAKRAAAIPNVKMHGRIPHADMAGHYESCHFLCCTSVFEGFPNTFLEAWSLGIPVISTFDPDGAIATHGLGWVARDVDGIVRCLRDAVQSPETWHKASLVSRKHYLAHHTPETCLPAMEHLLLKLAGNGAATEAIQAPRSSWLCGSVADRCGNGREGIRKDGQ